MRREREFSLSRPCSFDHHVSGFGFLDITPRSATWAIENAGMNVQQLPRQFRYLGSLCTAADPPATRAHGNFLYTAH